MERSKMNFKAFLPLLIVVSFTFPEFGGTYIIHFSVERYNETVPVEKRNDFSCYCNGQTRNATLEKHVLGKMFQNVQNHKFCVEDEDYELHYCDWLKECQKCTGLMETCTASSTSGIGYDCTKETFQMQEKFLITLNSTHGGVKHNMRRQAATCFYPTDLKTASLSITKHPSYIRIKQDCIFGHTLKEGISREMRCLHAENKWKPFGFEECLPFVDCGAKLILPGLINCVTATPVLPPTCTITCHGYEDKPAVPATTYECKAHGGWQPKLPHCAVSGMGMDLVPAPRVRVHFIESETTSTKSMPTFTLPGKKKAGKSN